MPSNIPCRWAGLAVAACLVGASSGIAIAQVIDRLDTVAPFLDECVTRDLKGNGFRPRRDVTLRLSFRRDGSIIGVPVVTYSRPAQDDSEQRRFIAAVTGAFRTCAPLPFSNELGSAIAGKIFTFRYTLTAEKDQSL